MVPPPTSLPNPIHLCEEPLLTAKAETLRLTIPEPSDLGGIADYGFAESSNSEGHIRHDPEPTNAGTYETFTVIMFR